MANVYQQLTGQFYRWERRGRGFQVYDEPVFPQPPFVPFDGHYLPETPTVDTGRRETLLSSFWKKISAPPPPSVEVAEPDEEPKPETLIRDPLSELQVILPVKLDTARDSLEQFFSSLSFCKEPIAFELLGAHKKVTVQFAAAAEDASLLRRQLLAQFQDIQLKAGKDTLIETWDTCSGNEELVVEFGLGREFMFMLANGNLDPFVSLIGALSELDMDELGLFQVLWQPLHDPWPESIVRSVTDDEGKPFFVNVPELASAAETKVSKPLFAAVVRIATKAGTFKRALQIAADMAGSLRTFADPEGNHLIPLGNDVETYSLDDHITDMLFRQSRRSGMILNSDELAGFVHLPANEVQSPVLPRNAGETKTAPDIVRNKEGLVLGNNVHLGETVPVVLTPEERVYHTHIIGTTGTGKSTLLFNLIQQDIDNNQGVAVLDPHGDLINRLLGIIPQERINDVVLVDLEDEDFPVGFNILHAHSSHERKLLASDLVSLFRRLSTSWGDQMDAVLHNAILAFLYSSHGGTLADLRRFLVEERFRTEFLETVSDPNILYYWQKGFTALGGNRSIGSVITRLNDFLSEPPIYNMVSQPANRLNFEDIMDNGKIFLAKLPEGIVGRENSYLLGAVLVSKFQQLVMARQRQKVEARRDFWIYIDEFANFITPSMAEILSGARKYRIGLTLAHHELHQLQRVPEVASAVMAHPHTRIVFRVSDDDAKKLAEGFSSFKANRLKNLGKGEAIARVERSDFDFNLTVLLPDEPDSETAAARRQEAITRSEKKYGTSRKDLDAMLAKAGATSAADEPPAPFKFPKQPISVPNPESPMAAEVPSSSPPIVTPHPEAPKLADIPKSTEVSKAVTPVPTIVPHVIEMPMPAVAPPASVEPKTTGVKHTQALSDLGRGGAPHRAIQERLQAEAQRLGFQSEVEKQLSKGSNQAADLVLRRDNAAIAIEIAVTTTVSHEFENVQKCLEAGFKHVAVIATSPKRLDDIANAVKGGLGPEMATKVGYYSPDEFIVLLEKMAAELTARSQPPSLPHEKKRRGITVRRHLPQLSAEEQKLREELVYRMLAEAVKCKR